MPPKKAKKTKEQIEEERRQAEEAARLAEEGGCSCTLHMLDMHSVLLCLAWFASMHLACFHAHMPCTCIMSHVRKRYAERLRLLEEERKRLEELEAARVALLSQLQEAEAARVESEK